MQGFILSYHDKETLLFTIDPYYGNYSYHNKETILFTIDPCIMVRLVKPP